MILKIKPISRIWKILKLVMQNVYIPDAKYSLQNFQFLLLVL